MTLNQIIRKIKIRRWSGALIATIIFVVVVLVGSYAFLPGRFVVHYDALNIKNVDVKNEKQEINSEVSHIKTPDQVKAIYMTSCVASTPSLRNKLSELFVNTEINSIIIDIKDYSGRLSIPTEDKELQTNIKVGCFIPDIKDFISTLHKKGVYVIGRITVFQDPYYSKLHSELAVKKASDGSVWKDRKGLSFIDVSAKPYWEYISKIGHESVAIGFDELNFDYIRFPSDGDMKNISYPWSKKMEKKEALRLFFGYLKKQFRDTGAKISADLFGMTTTNTDDLNIGQYLEYTLPYFDYVAPMVYPSHYPPTWNGIKNPAEKPYEVVYYSMKKAYERASTTPEKLRPWLQDFNLGATYTAGMVRAQIKAVYDVGLDSWMLWSASNRYTTSALENK